VAPISNWLAESPDFPTRREVFQGTYNGLTDGFFARLNVSEPAGEALACSSYFGESGMDVPYAIASDNLDNFYLAGVPITRAAEFPVDLEYARAAPDDSDY
jgi:hypothetical protein